MGETNIAAPASKGRMKYSAFAGQVNPAGSSSKVLEALNKVDQHVVGEELNDIPYILESVAQPPLFVVRPYGKHQILTDMDSITEYYNWTRREAFEVEYTLPIKQVASDWYVFWEQLPRMRFVENSAGGRAVGSEMDTHSVAFFPATAAGVMEMPGGGDPAYEATALVGGSAPAKSDPTLEARNIISHNTFLKHLRNGDLSAAADLFVEGCGWFIRDYVTSDPIARAVNRGQALDMLVAFDDLYKIDGLAVLNRVSSSWYIFSEQLFQLTAKRVTPEGHVAGARLQLRTAGVTGVDDKGRFTGQMAYGTDVETI
ncbi:hypothetical protein [Sphingopyxis flava]|uniref:Uncharacterized protein n=1 Tax=Sphingopyxis flava TaxID=1507287 RepID=A0A1T5G451_9SPHN|nr:hypothetical protein [Sphingopyxis flava]SKC03167.1 hypothetical protein SAMN06295937_10562 [Sphingopyxis flava]